MGHLSVRRPHEDLCLEVRVRRGTVHGVNGCLLLMLGNLELGWSLVKRRIGSVLTLVVAVIERILTIIILFLGDLLLLRIAG